MVRLALLRFVKRLCSIIPSFTKQENFGTDFMEKLSHLQGLRGFAILSVVFFHYFPKYCPNGYLGVDIFFVLSGYLMALTMSNDKAPSFFKFYYRRIKRILPLYYGIVLICTLLLLACSCSEQQTNLVSSLNAILFKTNLVWETGNDYFQKLGTVHDIFTHTWSLCVEVQFYLVFPLIWLCYNNIRSNIRLAFLVAISAISLLLSYNYSEEKAFYNVLCRLWQFLAGCLVFHNEQGKNPIDEKQAPTLEAAAYDDEGAKNLEDEEKMTLLNLEEFGNGEVDSSIDEKLLVVEAVHTMKCCLIIVLLFFTIFLRLSLSSVYIRVIITIAAALLISMGKNFYALENLIIVFLGKISYSWYLIHWPMLSFQKIFFLEQSTSYTFLFGNLLVGSLLSIFVYYAIEKQYLIFGKIAALSTVFMLSALCLIANYYIFEAMGKLCSSDSSFGLDFRKMTKAEIKKYNFDQESYEYVQLRNKDCVFEPSSSDFQGFCRFNNTKTNNPKKLLIVGNSWAANVASIIFAECSEKFGNIYRISYAGCEFLYDHLMGSSIEHCEKARVDFSEAVRKVQPDYLFLISKYMGTPKKKTPEEMEEAVQTAIQRLQETSRLVREKIFVLNTFKGINISAAEMAKAIDQNYEPKLDVSQQDDVNKPSFTRKEIEKIVATCPKCELFDYTPSFMINGTFYLYDPVFKVTYFTLGKHLTQPGLQRVHHLYTDICRNKIKI